MDRSTVQAWVGAYERAWREPGTEHLGDLFAPDIGYLVSPWAEPLTGLPALAKFWEAGRDGPGESFTIEPEVVAVDGVTAVVRAEVDYPDQPARWRDLWILRFDDQGRCTWFEEWPFAPGQPDGQDQSRAALSG
ncbi:nuclear transport factor 2 family protein [Nocardia brasiliensis]|uniref:nuclear transport factor 2 family protein n=1 Tax=Nocardia brasiliensis TaxID=37326 RepID=UPI003D8E7C71